jgi:ATP-dependent Lon protease
LKEKALAAQIAGVKRVILPKLNRRDLVEVPATIQEDLEFFFVDHMDEVLQLALTAPPGSASGEPVAAPVPENETALA